MLGRNSKNKKRQKKKDLPILNQRNETKSAVGIGATLSFNGELSGKEDLYINGKVQGSIIIDNHTLTIGSSGQIEADIQAKNVTVKGQVKGNIKARNKVYIHETAKVIGDIVAANISVMDGAQFEGNAKIQKTSPPISPKSEQTERKTDSLLIEDEFLEE